jgi:hypothetical protein
MRTISIRTTLSKRGLVTINNKVNHDKHYDPITKRCTGSPWWIVSLLVTDTDSNDITGDLDDYETEKAEECLIDKYQEEQGTALDRLVDEAIERGKEYKHRAYA